MNRASSIAILILLAALPARAQDWLRLEEGPRLRGEILEETETSYRFVTTLGELLVVEKAQVKKAHRGRGPSKTVLSWLEGVDPQDAEALFSVARRAAAERRSRRDGERLARRVLVLEPEHLAARRLLGHVKALGVWYEDADAARKGVGAAMKEEGYLEHEGGFCRPEQLPLVKADPGSWTLEEETFLWRRTADLMRERGHLAWKKEWYPPEEGDLVADLEAVEDIVGVSLDAARAGASAVYTSFGRKGSLQHAEELEKARVWWIDTFRPERREALMAIPARCFVFREAEEAVAFISKGGGRLHDASEEQVKFSLPLADMSFGALDQVTNQTRGNWRSSDVARYGLGLMNREWTGRGSRCPDWLDIASAHHAEIAVFGAAKTWFIAPSKYDRQEQTRTAEGRTIDLALQWYRELADKRRVPSLRTLFSKRTNQMTVEDDVAGIVVLAYLLAERKDQLLAFAFGSVETEIPKRFEAAFGHPFEAEDPLLAAWVEKR